MTAMKDVQNDPALVPLSIDRVGVRGIRLPVVVRDRARGSRHSVAVVELSVDLPAEFKGTHMSRFVEVLKDWSDDQKLDHKGIHNLLKEVKHRLHARRSHVEFRFPFFQHRTAPATGSPGLMSYDCRMTGELDCQEGKPSKLRYLLEVEVPVMTVCPCSLAICDHGAHSQRALIRIQTRFDGFLWLEDLIAIGEASGSSPVYPLLKREDEKSVVETAFSNPTFVEDAVRNAAQALENHPQVRWFRVEVESCESIHNHNAFAAIEKHVDRLAAREKKGTKA